MFDFNEGVARTRAGTGTAWVSVCSAHPDVLRASLRLARDSGAQIIVEATSNQVNQFGGYTGLTPAQFIAEVQALADRLDCPRGLLAFGGDHLGPQAWKSEPPEAAMEKAEGMIRAFVQAGFSKVHLDCSEGCAGEPAQVGDALAAERAARLAAVAEAASPGTVSYVVGTEVPPPGGARNDAEEVTPTDPQAARRTLTITQAAFEALGLQDAWSRVHWLVVQPGLEFAPAHVHPFDRAQPDALSAALADRPGIAFEAHSTDYQAAPVFADLARRNFAVLKVGPALSFALREALYALSHVDGWLSGAPHLGLLMEELMLENPGVWQGHYHGTPEAQRLLRHFGYADRIRYLWAQPRAQQAVSAMNARLDAATPPLPLLAQYLTPAALTRARALQGTGLPLSQAVIDAYVEAALRPYIELKS
ncbi:class II D-tagatose-bisphosphate aldolase, non-catalytic subunit [Pseudooceanicola sp. CBS1P-1]|uniref:Tagatose-6-phosphate kinase n=1 Tax=Pseudooceanicola albus TaxID=2692189 RepID=A0A6L7G4R4_9RHOB|nr:MULTISPECIES: class II D-tagatose-bisphosphate aldolase, non-catalytic subunit [Pseudooceanicola]MBT9385200.1 class II D-tagatose-bisphosphate aldolase, non-catalytic subunit [Pseudooceanicola endophyticus]MXN18508.1 tagatose-6-phosphate kinase [Pseudooceanicola albus]